jgi:predicted MFS family arabinose efflux permease
MARAWWAGSALRTRSAVTIAPSISSTKCSASASWSSRPMATFPTALASVVVYGLSAWSVTVPQQHRMMDAAPQAATLVASLNASAAYLAVALSGALGAATLQVMPARFLPWIAAACTVLGLAASRAAGRPGRDGPP